MHAFVLDRQGEVAAATATYRDAVGWALEGADDLIAALGEGAEGQRAAAEQWLAAH